MVRYFEKNFLFFKFRKISYLFPFKGHPEARRSKTKGWTNGVTGRIIPRICEYSFYTKGVPNYLFGQNVGDFKITSFKLVMKELCQEALFIVALTLELSKFKHLQKLKLTNIHGHRVVRVCNS